MDRAELVFLITDGPSQRELEDALRYNLPVTLEFECFDQVRKRTVRLAASKISRKNVAEKPNPHWQLEGQAEFDPDVDLKGQAPGLADVTADFNTRHGSGVLWYRLNGSQGGKR